MTRFFFRHWTGTAVVAAIVGWAAFYLPATPSFAIFQLKRAVDARDGDAAARFVNFESVAKNAGNELAAGQAGGGNLFNQLLAQGAVALLYKPVADAARSWVTQEVNSGAREVQMPAAAVAGTIVLLHRSGDTAYTKFQDRKGRVWEVHMVRNGDGQWQITEVNNIRQILERLQQEQGRPLDSPG